MAESLKALRNVAALDAKILELEHRQKQIPGLIRTEQQAVERASQNLARKAAELKDLKAKTALQETEFRAAEEAVIKLRNQINQARSNKEFQALQHEILSKEADNQRLEDAVLLQMQKVDNVAEERDALADARKQAETRLTEKVAALEKDAADAESRVRKLNAQRSVATKNVPAEILGKYERLIARRGQTAMVAVVNGTCQGCFMTMRPETMAQLKKAIDLVACHSCGRILYLEEE